MSGHILVEKKELLCEDALTSKIPNDLFLSGQLAKVNQKMFPALLMLLASTLLL